MSNTIRILLVDDHAVVRSGLSKFLMVNKDFELVGEAADGAEAIQMVSLHKPDVVLTGPGHARHGRCHNNP